MHLHSSRKKQKQRKYELAISVSKSINREWARGSWVVGEATSEIVTFNLSFSERKEADIS